MSLSTKTLNTRVIQKHDTAENWAKAVSFIPKKGEIIIYDADSNNPQPRIKIGNGTTTVVNLPFCNKQITDELATLRTDIDTLSTEIPNKYANKFTSNTFNGEQKMIFPGYCNTVHDIASGIGCSLKNSRALDNQMIVGEVYAPYTSVTDETMGMHVVKDEIPFYAIDSTEKPEGSDNQKLNKTLLGKITRNGFEGNATSATKATQDSNGKVIADTYETKTDANTKLTQAKTFATDEANRVKNDLLNGAGGAYDTLKELGDLIDTNVDAIEALETVATNKADKNHKHTCADITDLASTYETQTNASQKLTEAKGYTDTLKTNLTTGSVIPLRSGKSDYAERDLSGNVITSTYVKKTDIKNGSIAITIPAGRMCGDVNGDGKITEEDADIILNHVRGITILTDQIQLKCADVNNDNSVSIMDANLARMISNGTSFAGQGGDVLENWISNPNYNIEDMQFYIDIPIEGITSSNCATITISGTYKPNFFKAECINGAIRIYAKLCPLSAINAVVQYGVGNGTAIVIQENSEVVDLTSNQSINGIKSFNDGIKFGDAMFKYDYENKRVVLSFIEEGVE